MVFATIALGKGIQVPHSKLHQLLLVCAAYGVMHVLSDNLGLATAPGHRKLTETIPAQILILYSAAYIVTDKHYLSVISIGIFFILKLVYHQTSDKTSDETSGKTCGKQ